MKRSLFIASLLLVLFLPEGNLAQTYGHEWIDPAQPYMKLKLAEDGIYRVNYEDLQATGFLDNNPNPVHFQLFHRGEEVSIRVAGQNDLSFDPGDFIEFYGERNDGTRDRLLYKENAQPHDYYNLYSDTSAYFLTVNRNAIRGRRIENFTETFNTDNLPAEPYHVEERLELKTQNFSSGLVYNQEVFDAAFDFGEGWTGTRIRRGQIREDTLINLTDLYVPGPSPELDMLFAGRNNRDHLFSILVGPSQGNLRTLDTLSFQEYRNFRYQTTLNWSDISAEGRLFIQVYVIGATDDDFISVSYILLRFPQEIRTNAGVRKTFSLVPNPGNTSYLEINGIGTPGTLWDITDPHQPVNIVYPDPAGSINTLVPNTATARTLYYQEGNFPAVPSLEEVAFEQIDPGLYDYLMVYHRDFTAPAGNYENPVNAYLDYRSERFTPLAMEIHTLFDQFNYGEPSPLAIRNFCRYMIDNGNPEYLLLIGKALLVSYNYYRDPFRPGLNGNKDWVPTAGNPGSDILYTAGLDGNASLQAIPTGRIPARSALDVARYLDKVRETEAFPFDALWKKDIIQLSGGITPGELSLFQTYIGEFQASEEGPFFGAHVTNIFKESTATVETINISKEVNAGKSMIMFFGHSSPNITDIDIGYATDPATGYNNAGRYPLIFMNGCDVGNLFTPQISLGEDWITAGDKGAIAFSAHSDVGFRTQLKRFTDAFLETGFEDSTYVHQSLGKILKEAGNRYITDFTPPTEINVAQLQQTVLQGDPAVPLFGADRPDYAINEEEIFATTATGAPVSSVIDSFQIALTISNLGIVDLDSIDISVKRTYPVEANAQEEETLGPFRVSPVFYQDTVFLTIFNDRVPFTGENVFEITIDPENRIPELSENNNIAVFRLDIPRLTTINLYPYDFSIVNQEIIRLVAQSGNIVDLTRQFIFELDTSARFDSPVKQSAAVAGKWLTELEVDLFEDFPQQDSLVFYWRTRFSEALPGEEDAWSTSSFAYLLNGPEGWAQLSDDQLLMNSISGMSYDEIKRGFAFDSVPIPLEVLTFGNNHPEFGVEDISVRINGSEQIIDPLYCSDNSLNVIAFDRISGLPYLVLDYNVLNRRSCGRQPQLINNFLNTEIEGGADYNLSLLIDRVNTGDPVVLFSIGSLNYSAWSDALKTRLAELGIATALPGDLTDGEPLIILGRKGDPPGSARVIRADANATIPIDEQVITLDEEIFRYTTSATIISPVIGPSRAWGTFYQAPAGIDDPQEDRYSYTLHGIRNDGSSTVLFDQVNAPIQDLSAIDATAFPRLKITFQTKDTLNLTPAWPDHWILSYEPLPDGVLLPADEQELTNIVRQEGEPFRAGFIFQNISPYPYSQDTLLGIYTLINQESFKQTPDSLRIAAPPANGGTSFQADIRSLGFPGKNNFEIRVNPEIVPENFYRNNLLLLRDFATIRPDNIDPVIDVAFDGRYILDGEIVPPAPLISVVLKDENEYLVKEDTTGIALLIRYPEEEQSRRIAFSDPNLTWTPATEEEDFRIEYQPDPLNDGIYRLEVRAEDASGNEAGAEPYEISFEVINESQITHFYPFPNPFSTSTRFVFTLTGSMIPEEMKIQIMTVSGRVVREITSEEIGPIHIGNNITEYAWDGRDEYGDQLANGVYLYRVIINNPGDSFKHRETSGDQAFKKGFGKLYLLR